MGKCGRWRARPQDMKTLDNQILRLWWSNSFLKRWWSLLPCAWCFGPASSVLAFEATMISAWPNHEWLMLMQVGKIPRINYTVTFKFHVQYKRCRKKNTIASIASSFNLETSPTRSPGRPVANPWEWPQLPQQGAPIFFNRKSCHTLVEGLKMGPESYQQVRHQYVFRWLMNHYESGSVISSVNYHASSRIGTEQNSLKISQCQTSKGGQIFMRNNRVSFNHIIFKFSLPGSAPGFKLSITWILKSRLNPLFLCKKHQKIRAEPNYKLESNSSIVDNQFQVPSDRHPASPERLAASTAPRTSREISSPP